MNRLGCAILALFLIIGAGFALLIRSGGTGGPMPPPVASARPDTTLSPASPASPAGLAIPVSGVRPEQLVDTFQEMRGDRIHGAIDIMAPRGTPVVAAAPGTVEKIFESRAGGHTVYVRTDGGRWMQYYAHLDRYADGLAERMHVARGQVIGAVGSSGNANPEGPHLHFEIRRMEPGEKWYQGSEINPYPLLGGAPQNADKL